MSDQVQVTEREGLMVVTLNRPKKLNAVNREMTEVLRDVVWSFGDRQDLRVLIITAVGRYFTAGLDISPAAIEDRLNAEGASNTRIDIRRKYRARYHTLFDEIEIIEKPVILAAQGPCLGVGVELAASCDFRFCTPEAHFGLPEIRVGGIATSGGISRLARLVGPAWAKWISLAGKNIDAEMARRIGLVHEVYPAEEFLDRVETFARELISLPEEQLGLTKLAVDAVKGEDREKGRHIERLAFSALQGLPGTELRLPPPEEPPINHEETADPRSG